MGPALPERPILYHGLVRTDWGQIVATRGVDADGASLGTVVPALGARWSPDGSKFAYLTPGGSSLNVATLEGEERTVFNSTYEFRPIYAWPEWSPDGSRIALIEVQWCGHGSRISYVVVVDAESDKVLSRHGPFDFWDAEADPEYGPGNFSLPEALRWSPDGSKFLVSWDTAGVVDLATGVEDVVSKSRVVAAWTASGDAVYYFSTTQPDQAGNRAVTGFFLKELGADPVQLFDAQALSEIGLLGTPGRVPALMSLSSRGSKLVVATEPAGQGISVLRVYGLTEEGRIALDRPFQTVPSNGEILAMEWGPNDARIAAIARHESGDATLEVLDLATETWEVLPVSDIDPGALDRIDFAEKVLSWY